MSNFDNLLKNGGEPQKGRRVEFYIDCDECDEEITEVEYFPSESAILAECSHGHKKLISKVNIPL